ncbi:hypothetical protein G6F22_012761 [Rhizopus arrhizus]|nr:hypothetical protein G6F22_012761 [Rhizopus arrhizus]KAG1166748.1 hypothetical protein G6F35_018013 [Rhizopus arrhizus]KAG1245743.1 hypothetical protein G6F65_021063 [Rhizopus arrhizus]
MPPATPAATASLNPIVALPAHALSDAIRRRELSCVEVMRAYLAHIDRVNPKINAIVARLAGLDAWHAAGPEGPDGGARHGHVHGVAGLQGPGDAA